MGKKVFAVDLGGTNLRMAVVDADGNIEHRERCPTPRSEGPEAIVSAMVDLAAVCRSAVGIKENISIFGVAIPAIMNIHEGKIEIAPNLPMLDGIPFRSQLEKALGLPVVLENDATAAAIGEHWLGSSRGFDNSICVTLGTGVGGGIIVDGRPLRGADGTAGEIGHICVEPDGHPCGCGSWGCVEQYASATAVVRIAKEISLKCGSSLETSGPLTAKDVYAAAKQGNEAAVEAFRSVGTHLGLALAGLVNALNPEVIVFAGGMSAAWDLFIDSTRDQIRKRAFREPALRVKLVRAELGDDAGTLGVASLAFARADQGI